MYTMVSFLDSHTEMSSNVPNFFSITISFQVILKTKMKFWSGFWRSLRKTRSKTLPTRCWTVWSRRAKLWQYFSVSVLNVLSLMFDQD